MPRHDILAKHNRDGSYSASIPVGVLVSNAFVDYYSDVVGEGYQRKETLLRGRARDIEGYIRRCLDTDTPPKLFELTLNARTDSQHFEFDAVDDDGSLGILTFEVEGNRWLSVIDGGTRLEGLKNALAHGIIADTHPIDARVFVGLEIGEEVAHFLLINEKQKRVRTDLSLRIVQSRLDSGQLSANELSALTTVVPDTEAWRYEASRIAGQLNDADSSVWQGRIQMPNDQVTRPIKLQAFLTSLKPLLTNADLQALLTQTEQKGQLMVDGTQVPKADFLARVIKNFWAAVAEANPNAYTEPYTTVLWGSIGVSASHISLAPIIVTKLQSPEPSLTVPVFRAMVEQSIVADYPFWFSRKGTGSADDYPLIKGDATTYTGAAGYGRLAQQLETEWRSALHASPALGPVVA